MRSKARIACKHLLHHAPADRVVEVLVFLESLASQRRVDLQQLLVQRTDELHSANASSQISSILVELLGLGPEGNHVEPAHKLDVLRGCVCVFLAHRLDQSWGEGRRLALHGLEEHVALLRGEFRDVGSARLKVRFAFIESLPFVGELEASVSQAGIEVGLLRETRLVEDSIPVDVVQLLARIGVRSEEVKQSGLELVRVEGAFLVGCEVVWDELVPLLNANQLLEVVEEGRALLVGNAREGIIRILTLKVRDQLGVFVVFTELGDAVRQGLPADKSAEIADPLVVVDSSLDASFQVDSPAFVEPEVLPASAALRINMSAHARSGRLCNCR